MIGRNFLWIVIYFHGCDMYKKVSKENPEYDPLFKEKDFLENLEHSINNMFVSGCCLGVYESIAHVFGLMKFKVRII